MRYSYRIGGFQFSERMDEDKYLFIDNNFQIPLVTFKHTSPTLDQTSFDLTSWTSRQHENSNSPMAVRRHLVLKNLKLVKELL
jgi:hypothetical protein